MATFTEEWIIPSVPEDVYINFAHVVRVRFKHAEDSKGKDWDYAILELTDGTEAFIEDGAVKRLKNRLKNNLLNS